LWHLLLCDSSALVGYNLKIKKKNIATVNATGFVQYLMNKLHDQ